MFKSHQVISVSALIRHFGYYARRLNQDPQALLVMQKGRENLVLVNAGIFEDLLEFKLERDNPLSNPTLESTH